MDYTIYIVVIILGILFFMTRGMNRSKKNERKSRRFMEDYKPTVRGGNEDKSKITKEDKDT